MKYTHGLRSIDTHTDMNLHSPPSATEPWSQVSLQLTWWLWPKRICDEPYLWIKHVWSKPWAWHRDTIFMYFYGWSSGFYYENCCAHGVISLHSSLVSKLSIAAFFSFVPVLCSYLSICPSIKGDIWQVWVCQDKTWRHDAIFFSVMVFFKKKRKKHSDWPGGGTVIKGQNLQLLNGYNWHTTGAVLMKLGGMVRLVADWP